MTRRRFVQLGGTAAGCLALGGVATMAATWAPEADSPRMEMGDGMDRVLVVYGTKSGSAVGIAERIGETLAADGASVEVVPVETAGDPAGYDAVVVGSGVRVGQWHEPARAWVTEHAEALKARPTAFYTVGLMITQGPEKEEEVRGYTDPLIEATGVEPVDLGLFAGWNEPRRFNLIERTVMKAMKAPQGDFRDMDAIAAWARAAAPKLGLAG